MDGSKKNPEETQELPLDDLEGLFEETFNQLAEDSKKLIESNVQNTPPKTLFFEPHLNQKIKNHSDDSKEGSQKAKTSLRMKYEAEVQVFIKREGSLEDIRKKLSLSKRKMCQLLLVDPSAWTRWTKGKSDAPPHIYRALEWYLLLQEKHPEYKSTLWLNAVSRPQISKHELNSIKEELITNSKDLLTQEALLYMKEESQKRDNLKKEVKERVSSIISLKKWIYGLLVSQLLMAILLIVFLI